MRVLSTRPQRPRTPRLDPAAVVAASRLLGQPVPSAPDQVWVGDTTYLPLAGGRWYSLVTLRELMLSALGKVLTLRQPAPDLVIHANRGSQYTTYAYRQRIKKARALASALATPYDNAQAEAGWSILWSILKT